MKKILYFIWCLMFLIFLESCSKDKIEPNASKKTTVKQQSSTATSQPPGTPPPAQPGCPHAPSSGSEGK
jgi:hypothetical protein